MVIVNDCIDPPKAALLGFCAELLITILSPVLKILLIAGYVIVSLLTENVDAGLTTISIGTVSNPAGLIISVVYPLPELREYAATAVTTPSSITLSSFALNIGIIVPIGTVDEV